MFSLLVASWYRLLARASGRIKLKDGEGVGVKAGVTLNTLLAAGVVTFFVSIVM